MNSSVNIWKDTLREESSEVEVDLVMTWAIMLTNIEESLIDNSKPNSSTIIDKTLIDSTTQAIPKRITWLIEVEVSIAEVITKTHRY